MEALCDIVLPAACYPERNSLRALFYNLSTIHKVVDSYEECKDDAEIAIAVGKRLNPEAWTMDKPEDYINELLKPSGMTYQEIRQKGGWTYDKYVYKKYEKGMMRPDGQPGFNTTTGKFEFYSTFFARFNLPPLPFYNEPRMSPFSTPDLYKEYPLVLSTGARSKVFFHSEHRQIGPLREIHPDPVLEINPEYAAKHDIVTGDWVWVENPIGKFRQKAKVTPAIHPKMAQANYGWWFPEQKEPGKLGGYHDVNTNNVTEMGHNGITGFGADLKCTLCKVYKVKEGEM
jgi:anaerobic selenocysteine-containing dehydrogenase